MTTQSRGSVSTFTAFFSVALLHWWRNQGLQWIYELCLVLCWFCPVKGCYLWSVTLYFLNKHKMKATLFLLSFQSPVCAYGLLGMSSCKNQIFSYRDKGHISDLKEKEVLNPTHSHKYDNVISLLNKPNILEWTLIHIYMRKKSSTSRFLLKNVLSDGSMGRACSFSRSPPRFE